MYCLLEGLNDPCPTTLEPHKKKDKTTCGWTKIQVFDPGNAWVTQT